MNFSWLWSEALTAAWFKACHVVLLSTLIAYYVLTRLAFNWMDYDEFARWAHQILVNLVVWQDWCKLICLSQIADRICAHVVQTQSQDRLRLLNAVADLILQIGGDQLQLIAEGALVVQMACRVQQILVLRGWVKGVKKGGRRIRVLRSSLFDIVFLNLFTVFWIGRLLLAVNQVLMTLLWLLKDCATNQYFIREPITSLVLRLLVPRIVDCRHAWGSC